ncbi:MAG: MATE family efflux transporter [Hyphomonadaceae bacterium]
MAEAALRSAARLTPQERLRSGPILQTLLALSAPNLIALCSATIITIAETAYVGRLGVASLAGVALVFPVIMLMQMMSAGAMGGGISGAIARALGAGDTPRAEALALCAALIGLIAGSAFALIVWVAGPSIFYLLGGRGEALTQAIAYSNVAAIGILAIWLTNTMASVARGTGNMAAPAALTLAAGLMQITIGGALGLGFGPLPRLGMAGVAFGQVAGFSTAALLLFFLLRAKTARVRLPLDLTRASGARFWDILRVGIPAALSPIQSVATILIITAIIARFGQEALAGYGIGARLEFLLIPIAFSVGVACVPMVGTAIGAGDVARARAVAWTAGGLAMGALALIGGIAIATPDLWGRIFVRDEAVLAVTRDYLRIAGLGFPFFGLGLCLYFASQGAGKILGPLLAQTARLAVVILGGWMLVEADAPLWALFALIAFAMMVMGLSTAAFVRFTPWSARA